MLMDAVISSAIAFGLLFVVMILLALCVRSFKMISAFERALEKQETVRNQDVRETDSPVATTEKEKARKQPAASVKLKETDDVPQVVDAEGAASPEIVAAITGAVEVYLTEERGKGQSLLDGEDTVTPEIVAAISGAIQHYREEKCTE